MLRVRRGDHVEIVCRDTRTVYRAVLREVSPQVVSAELLDALQSSRPGRVEMLVGLVKPKVCDFIVEKCVELGAGAVRFFVSDRSQGARDSGAVDARLERFERIRDAALKQSKTTVATSLSVSPSLDALLAELPHGGRRLLCIAPDGAVSREQAAPIVEFFKQPATVDAPHRFLAGSSLENIAQPVETYVLVGPEGGFTPQELESARGYGFEAVTLGENVLRTETAVILACGLLQLCDTRQRAEEC